MPVKLDDFYLEALERIERNPQANEVVPRLLIWLIRGGEMNSSALEVLLALTPELDPEDWVEKDCLQEMKVDVRSYISMSEGLLRRSGITISFAHETIRGFLATTRSLHTNDWCLRSAAAFLALPSTLRAVKEITRSSERLLQHTENRRRILLEGPDCFDSLTGALGLHKGMAWLIPESMIYEEAHKRLWNSLEKNTKLTPILICASLDWLDHAVEAISHNVADPNSIDSNGRTMMHLVMRSIKRRIYTRGNQEWLCWDHAGLLETLKSSEHIDLSLRDHSGQTPLHLFITDASMWRAFLQPQKLIRNYWEPLLKGRHCTICDSHGLTPFHLAAQTANMNLTKMLTEWSGAYVNCLSVHGQTPVQWALHSLWARGQDWLRQINVRRFQRAEPSEVKEYIWWILLRIHCFGISLRHYFVLSGC